MHVFKALGLSAENTDIELSLERNVVTFISCFIAKETANNPYVVEPAFDIPINIPGEALIVPSSLLYCLSQCRHGLAHREKSHAPLKQKRSKCNFFAQNFCEFFYKISVIFIEKCNNFPKFQFFNKRNFTRILRRQGTYGLVSSSPRLLRVRANFFY